MSKDKDTAAAKRIVVLARNKPEEAMRVAAGLTISGNEIELVFMNRQLSQAEADSEHGELLELCDIEPRTTITAMSEHFELLNAQALGTLIKDADMVINL